MSDDIKRLLVLAAKAAGYDDAEYQEGDWMEVRYGFASAVYSAKYDGYLAPHVDDGDAFRLQVAIRAELKIWPGCELLKTPSGAEAWVFGRCFPVATADGRRDEEALRAAARLAIVNAAAYVVESMP